MCDNLPFVPRSRCSTLVLLGKHVFCRRNRDEHGLSGQYHVFNAAVCMGTLILQNPRNMLAPLAMSLIDNAINLYTNIVQSNSTGRLLKNLEWLLRLRQRANAKMAGSTADETAHAVYPESEEEDIELLGWRTRLVSRLGKRAQTAITITPTQSATTPSLNTVMTRTISQALQNHFVPDDAQTALQAAHSQGIDPAQDPATDAFVRPIAPLLPDQQLTVSVASVLGPDDAAGRAWAIRRHIIPSASTSVRFVES